MPLIEYWKDGERLQSVTRKVIPRAGDHVILRGEFGEAFKVESVVFDESDGQSIQISLTDGDF